jgi:hypothetical protein
MIKESSAAEPWNVFQCFSSEEKHSSMEFPFWSVFLIFFLVISCALFLLLNWGVLRLKGFSRSLCFWSLFLCFLHFGFFFWLFRSGLIQLDGICSIEKVLDVLSNFRINLLLWISYRRHYLRCHWSRHYRFPLPFLRLIEDFLLVIGREVRGSLSNNCSFKMIRFIAIHKMHSSSPNCLTRLE